MVDNIVITQLPTFDQMVLISIHFECVSRNKNNNTTTVSL